jgi:CRP-like cAMP-binding protein
MDIVKVVSNVHQARLLEGLSRPEIGTLFAAATEHHLKPKLVVHSQGDSADHLWLLTEGAARHFYVTESGQKVILLLLRNGDVFGGRTLLRERCSYLVSTETLKPSTVLVWHRKTIHELLDRYPRARENALAIASDYVAWYLSTHLALVTQEARARLAEVVLSLSEGIGGRTDNGVELTITNEELANTANVTLFTVSRILSEWRRGGVLNKTRGKILLSSRDGLRQVLRTTENFHTSYGALQMDSRSR